MAAPNIVNVTSIYGKTALTSVSTVTSNVITNASGSSNVLKINNIILSNYTSTSAGANVILNRSSTTYYLGGSLTIPPNSMLVVVAKDTSLYLEEGDVIQVNATVNSAINFTSSYEQIS